MKMLVLSIGLFGSLCMAASPGHAIGYGVNGHPGTQQTYNDISISTQLNLITGLGAHWYRDDWNENNYNANPSFFPNLVTTAAASNITILPVAIPINGCWSNATTAQIQSDSYNYGYQIANANGSRVTYYELDNELDNYAILPGASGTSTSDYDPNKIGRAFTEVNALAQGIKAANPNAKVMIDAGWVHYGYIQALIYNGFQFDVLAWHWYSDMGGGDITNVGSYGNVWNTLASFGKPIWITEGGNVNSSDDDPTQANLIASHAAQFAQLGAVNYFEYELLDEPNQGGIQAWFGLYHTSYNSSGVIVLGTAKAAYSSYKNAISSGGAFANGVYTLTPQCATGSRLDAAGFGTTNGTKVQIWQANGGSNQQWIFTHMGNGYYKIQPYYDTALALDDYGAGSANGTVVDLWADNGSSAQRWTPVWVNSGYSFVPQCATGSRLDVTGAGTANGTQVEIWQSNGSNAQIWTLGTN